MNWKVISKISFIRKLFIQFRSAFKAIMARDFLLSKSIAKMEEKPGKIKCRKKMFLNLPMFQVWNLR